MNTLIVLSALVVAVAICAPVEESFVNFSEDTLGNYKLNFNTKDSSRTEERSQDGKVIGSFSFLDTDGVKHTVSYVAAGDGFKADGADLPVPVSDTEDIINSRSAHLALVEHEKATHPKLEVEEEDEPVADVLAKLVLPEIASLPASAVPEEDAETSAARAEFLVAYGKALESLAEAYKKIA